MGGSQSTELGQPSKLSAPLPSLRWELQSRPKGLIKIDDFRLIEEVSNTWRSATPRLTLHHHMNMR
jgi:hypothetical protein